MSTRTRTRVARVLAVVYAQVHSQQQSLDDTRILGIQNSITTRRRRPQNRGRLDKIALHEIDTN